MGKRYVYVKENIGSRSKTCFGKVGDKVEINIETMKLFDYEEADFIWRIDKCTKNNTDKEIAQALNVKFKSTDAEFKTIFEGSGVEITINDKIVSISNKVNLLDYITRNIKLKGNPVIEYNNVVLRSDNMFNSCITLYHGDIINIWNEKEEIDLNEPVDNH